MPQDMSKSHHWGHVSREDWCNYVNLFRVYPHPSHMYIPLDWPWIAEWAYAGIFAVAVQFQNQDKFWISRHQGSFFIFS